MRALSDHSPFSKGPGLVPRGGTRLGRVLRTKCRSEPGYVRLLSRCQTYASNRDSCCSAPISETDEWETQGATDAEGKIFVVGTCSGRVLGSGEE
jgi:hypothetical protein